ncbi:hypothetical protein ACFOLJ_09185 [Rugamonas sp. CCM 8940]|uniref:hypothetical protein n=1 Tax=Rugamonas sp. CCM 8940 TaxID=2765359 RepID=UPI0018F531EC|nr:hypothetical protein [Rugamonas sp. CCM 8940]MBJ7309361.1 hypothetical protein [Rugamonas sp. CCM 8940]
MQPTQWSWAPQIHLPWSGSVAQEIGLKSWFDAIPAKAGDGDLELQVFNQASYGRQLGWLSELLLDLAERHPPATDKGKEARDRLKDAAVAIEGLKEIKKNMIRLTASDTLPGAPEVAEYMRRLKHKDPGGYAEFCAEMGVKPV